MRIVFFISACLFWLNAHAAGPVPLATINRSFWPEQLTTPALFDVASRAEILAFAHALIASEAQDEAALKVRLGLRKINMVSLNLIRQRFWTRLLENYQFAQRSCEEDASFCVLVDDMETLREQATKFVIADDSFYAAWDLPSHAFQERYLTELLHMAALFPLTSSEIERYNSDELTGDELGDRTFLLSFNSGPTVVDGTTDWLTDYLRQRKLNATFFVLGKTFQTRQNETSAADVQALYKQQCVGSEGWQYRSHSQWVDWQSSVTRSAVLLQQALPDDYIPLFRPPYGQRRADSAEFFRAQGLKVSLWNIDSEDWSREITADQTGQRVLTLMLLWRRGVIVFHDTNNKIETALPWLLANTAQSGLQWQDCHGYP
ncbi:MULTISPECIES: polysaccharide deacetylase family protein [unclassified Pseudomonas]|uniref:polysaccharide deacetylase family protein n=1 Tax=unclassified Pseudomonas TaxID=196821 RepID=UPI002AC8D975|nr:MULTISPECIES: polysaccharide deacetylase family protein [unclassified Pseudomonas]MEB0042921.1 polysaccharide deacetylase family protein [Pseudomonas sp. MH10]MEB0077632.1 polysaccharide deacetylase family protein [Pseudomonas sp. MH10out]MEB0094227.1 polysaccharide deacetylase family protein [Pseudomonas sp. CCI4.2]MEB0101803.1 polysaccharide deacetylase family protein [Pseudomonas sp. CCI3.2]MEB0121624.1 polysaccharide deacetylase family protein [Pseudomonas sp. CCI1.2]